MHKILIFGGYFAPPPCPRCGRPWLLEIQRKDSKRMTWKTWIDDRCNGHRKTNIMKFNWQRTERHWERRHTKLRNRRWHLKERKQEKKSITLYITVWKRWIKNHQTISTASRGYLELLEALPQLTEKDSDPPSKNYLLLCP